MKRFLLSLVSLSLVSFGVRAQNWPQFRGPAASGVTEGRAAPVKWDVEKSQNVLWKTPIPVLEH